VPSMEKSQHTPEYRKLLCALVAVRKGAGLSQRALARRLNVAASWVSKVETGERRIDLVEFFWFCEACNCDSSTVASEVLASLRSSRVRLARSPKT
jgi:transcriptional regulator with XRE-family HTH domain